MTARTGLRDIEARHPALRGEKSAMQTIRIRTGSSDPSDGTEAEPPVPRRDLSPLLAGAATAVAVCGALLVFTGSASPLRGPLTLFFLLAAPAAAIAAALRGLDPFGRTVAAVAGAIVMNMLVAQGMLAVHRWSVRGGVAAVTVISALVFLLVLLRRWRGRT
ncbi:MULTISPECIES: hypothetical protein [Streptomyces]|uniref:Integral membrane protein n=1 Tax=Streptomyces griseosporeus TaxID=1910 RepID=A0ABV3KXU9_STRGS|nr:hypothetical protein [Streptomyces actuosus]